MPTYEYHCEACGHDFELFQSITAGPIKKCPKCGKLKVRRLIGTGAGVIFKGSGFYITDYRSEGYQKDAKAESGSSETKSDAKTDAKSDSKTTETKTEPKPAAPETKPTKSETKPTKSSKKS